MKQWRERGRRRRARGGGLGEWKGGRGRREGGGQGRGLTGGVVSGCSVEISRKGWKVERGWNYEAIRRIQAGRKKGENRGYVQQEGEQASPVISLPPFYHLSLPDRLGQISTIPTISGAYFLNSVCP